MVQEKHERTGIKSTCSKEVQNRSRERAVIKGVGVVGETKWGIKGRVGIFPKATFT